nr:MAG TPA: Protein of unknown function (DUF2570) [Caudoviricetes sp.]
MNQKEKFVAMQYACISLIVVILITIFGCWHLESRIAKLEFENERQEYVIGRLKQLTKREEKKELDELHKVVAKTMANNK